MHLLMKAIKLDNGHGYLYFDIIIIIIMYYDTITY